MPDADIVLNPGKNSKKRGNKVKVRSNANDPTSPPSMAKGGKRVKVSPRKLVESEVVEDEAYLTLEYLNYKTRVENSRRLYFDATTTTIQHQAATPETEVASTRKATAVIYSAPTSVNLDESKNRLYLKNFEFFLKNGVNCMLHDTYLVMTNEVAKVYEKDIRALRKEECTHSIVVLEREDRCYDMESMRVFLQTVNLDLYDHFVYVNCGMVSY